MADVKRLQNDEAAPSEPVLLESEQVSSLPRHATKARRILPQEFYHLLVDAVTDYAIFALDVDGYISTWNQGAYRLNGYTEEEAIGSHFSRFYTAEDIARNHPQNELKKAVVTGKYEEEGWRVRKDGTRFWANVVLTPILDVDGRLQGFSKVTRDLTERKRAEEKLRQLNESLEKRVRERTLELEEAVRARDEFMSVASHELKTPLTSLMLQAQMRKRTVSQKGMEGFSKEKLFGLFENDEKQLRRLGRLVDDMLDISRIARGKLSLDLTESDLSAVIIDVLARFAPQLQEAGCEVKVESEGAAVGCWDTFRIEQVFINLLTNAMKYGAGKPIMVSVGKMNGHARLSVKDHGIGIRKSDQHRIFEQFERAVSACEVSGLGLGLYISKQLVDAHHGKIHVESVPGEGATFTVELPLKFP